MHLKILCLLCLTVLTPTASQLALGPCAPGGFPLLPAPKKGGTECQSSLRSYELQAPTASVARHYRSSVLRQTITKDAKHPLRTSAPVSALRRRARHRQPWSPQLQVRITRIPSPVVKACHRRGHTARHGGQQTRQVPNGNAPSTTAQPQLRTRTFFGMPGERRQPVQLQRQSSTASWRQEQGRSNDSSQTKVRRGTVNTTLLRGHTAASHQGGGNCPRC